MKFKALNTREVKFLLNNIKEQYDIKDLDLDYYFFENNKGKINVISKDYREINPEKFRINKLGLYFATREKDGIRLSLEGAQIIGKKARKNVYNASNEDISNWVKGFDLEIKEELSGYVIIKRKEDIFGAGKFSKNRILNFVAKERRIKSDIKSIS